MARLARLIAVVAAAVSVAGSVVVAETAKSPDDLACQHAVAVALPMPFIAI
jgi:hypothetical protein